MKLSTKTLITGSLVGLSLIASPSQAASPTLTNEQWLNSVFAEAQVTPLPTTTYTFTNEGNCGAELSETNTGGCNTWEQDMSGSTVTISPALVGTDAGKHIVLHETYHTFRPYDSNECNADAYAQALTVVDFASYDC